MVLTIWARGAIATSDKKWLVGIIVHRDGEQGKALLDFVEQASC